MEQRAAIWPVKNKIYFIFHRSCVCVLVCLCVSTCEHEREGLRPCMCVDMCIYICMCKCGVGHNSQMLTRDNILLLQ